MPPSSPKFIDLAPELTLEEKVALLSGKDFRTTAGVPRLNIPGLKTVDSVNGIRPADFHGSLTTACFPSTTCFASTWNTDLLYTMGEHLARQAKLKSAQVVLGPTLNIHRDPRSGRNFECLSEDPLLSGVLGAAIVNGIQKHGVGACPKHLVCNDAETWRKKYDVKESINGRTVREIYLAAFQHLLRNSDPVGLMTAYNKVDGTYCGEHAPLIQEVLRGQWGFKGITISDWFGTMSTGPAIDAGLDLEMPFPVFRAGRLLKEVKEGKVSEKSLDPLVSRLLGLRDRTKESHSDEPERSEISEETNKVARDVAAEGIVLLKNTNNILPLDVSKSNKIAMIGEFATSPVVTGGGSASATPQYLQIPLDILRKAHATPDQVVHAPGVRTRVIIPKVPSEILTAKEGKRGVDVAYFNGDASHPLLEEYQEEAMVAMLADYKPGLDLANSRIEMTTKLSPQSDGDHTLAVRVTGEFSLEVDGKEVLSGPAPNITTEQSLFCPIMMESRVQLPMKAGGTYSIKLTVKSRPVMDNEPTPYGATICFEEFFSEDDAIADAVEAAKSSDVAVIYAGRSEQYESEGFDLADMHMPANQTKLIKAIAAVAPKTVLILHCGNPIDVSPFVDDVSAVLNAHFPGQEGAQATIDVLTGKTNPSGKLATTWFKAVEDAPSFGNFPPEMTEDGKCEIHYAEGVAVGYRAKDIAKRARWPFGYGLSYTTFTYDNFVAKVDGQRLKCSVKVTNTGAVPGKEVVQLYVSPSKGTSVWRPEKELKAFTKVLLEPGLSSVVEQDVDLPMACSYWDEKKVAWHLEEGIYGASIAGQTAEFTVSTAKLWNHI